VASSSRLLVNPTCKVGRWQIKEYAFKFHLYKKLIDIFVLIIKKQSL